MLHLRVGLAILGFLLSAEVLASNMLNGFDLSRSLIPTAEILQGGPPRDGIPAIDEPAYLTVEETRYLKDSDLVLGLEYNGIAKAYPIRILVWHEIVNTDFNGEPVVITFCPLCGTGLAFAAKMGGKQLDFGVSGLLHNSDLLMYDRQTDSLWSQIPGQAVTGPMAGKTLQRLAVVHLPWREWRQRHPESQILSNRTGSDRDYNRDPYVGYERTERLYFPVSRSDERYSAKTWVLGLESNGVSKVWPFPELAKTPGKITDTFAGQNITIQYDPAQETAAAYDAQGKLLPAVRAYWFAWYGFYPDTQVYIAGQ
jgi:hypothetical protein